MERPKPRKALRARQSYRKFYDYRWSQYSEEYRRRHPYCVLCQAEGIVTSSAEVDHIKPFRGNRALFDDVANHQALCHDCHTAKTARGE